jgi:hypothetical protein
MLFPVINIIYKIFLQIRFEALIQFIKNTYENYML